LFISLVNSPVLHFAFIVAHFAVRFEILKELQAFAFLLANRQRMIARGQGVNRIWILFSCKQEIE